MVFHGLRQPPRGCTASAIQPLGEAIQEAVEAEVEATNGGFRLGARIRLGDQPARAVDDVSQSPDVRELVRGQLLDLGRRPATGRGLAAGFPLTQLAIRRFGRRGTILTAGACAGLAVRDAAMIAAGIPSRLRTVPAALLWLELVVAVAAASLGLRLAIDREGVGRAGDSRRRQVEAARRTAVGALFALHTCGSGSTFGQITV